MHGRSTQYCATLAVDDNPEVMWRVPRGDFVYKKEVLKGLKMDLSNAESTTDS
jgi:hypothetical protein